MWRNLKASNVSTSTKIRLVFTVPWMLCVAVAIVQARFDIRPITVNLVWPFLFFYLTACLLEKASHSSKLAIGERGIWVMIALLVAVDHVWKFTFNHIIPLGDSVPVVANRLHLANFHNIYGTWVSAEWGASPVIVQTLVVSVVCVALAPLLYSFYSERHRKSFWSVLAYVCFVAGNVSAAIDLGVRGFVVDYLYLPGLFAADLKDIYLTIFASALFVEALLNPRISMRWLGWREELREFPNLVLEIVRFSVGKIRRIRRPIIVWRGNRKPRS